MRNRIFALAFCLVVPAGLALAQEPEEKPTPGPEHKKLNYFVGDWITEGETKPNPFMPAGKFTSNDSCKWFEGGFAVVCNYKGKGPAGPTKGLGVLGYSPEAKAYTYYGLDNSPMVMLSVPRGTVQGDTWVYDDESEMGGKTVKSRYTIQETTQASYTFKWELLGEDGSWLTIMEGKSTKS
jgi:hypothetical protein